MFGLGMGELLFFGVIALIVLGPEKLPMAIRSVMRWTHQLKKLINNVQSDIERELEITQMRQKIAAELDSFKVIEEQMQNQLNQIQKEMEQIEKNQPSSELKRHAEQADILQNSEPSSINQSQAPQTDPIWPTRHLERESDDRTDPSKQHLHAGSPQDSNPAQDERATQVSADQLRIQTT